MSKSEELVRIIETLPADRVQEVLDFASSLADKARKDDEEWERKLADPKYSSKMKSFFAECEKEIAEGKVSPMPGEDVA
jgi:hypothetical protein